MKIKLPKWSYAPLCVAFWIALWWVVAALFNKPLLLPTPLQTLKALGALAATGEFYLTVFFSLTRILIGILLALVGGTLLALLTVKNALCLRIPYGGALSRHIGKKDHSVTSGRCLFRKSVKLFEG